MSTASAEVELSTAIIGAAGAFLAALIAVIVGGLLTRAAEERAWTRQQKDRRRLRGEEAADGVLRLLDEATSLFRDAAARPPGTRQSRDVTAFVDVSLRVRSAAVRIPDLKVRGAAMALADVVREYDPIVGKLSYHDLIMVTQREVPDVIGAYLRGDSVPDFPALADAARETKSFDLAQI